MRKFGSLCLLILPIILQSEEKTHAFVHHPKLSHFNTFIGDSYVGKIENSKLITEDIELKLRAGAASVIDLATEKMNFYDLRGQMIALEYKNISEIINFYKAIGHQCDLTELCGQINLVAPAK